MISSLFFEKELDIVTSYIPLLHHKSICTYGVYDPCRPACLRIFLATRISFCTHMSVFWVAISSNQKNKKSSTRSKLWEATMGESCKQNWIDGSALAHYYDSCVALSCLLVFVVLDFYYGRKQQSGDGYFVFNDSSFKDKCRFAICINKIIMIIIKVIRRSGDVVHNPCQGHSILIKVPCCCCCFFLIVAFVLCLTLLSYSFYNLHKDYFPGANSTYDWGELKMQSWHVTCGTSVFC